MTDAKKVQIIGTANPFARDDVGKIGIIIGDAALGMVIVLLEGVREYWAEKHNLRPVD